MTCEQEFSCNVIHQVVAIDYNLLYWLIPVKWTLWSTGKLAVYETAATRPQLDDTPLTLFYNDIHNQNCHIDLLNLLCLCACVFKTWKLLRKHSFPRCGSRWWWRCSPLLTPILRPNFYVILICSISKILPPPQTRSWRNPGPHLFCNVRSLTSVVLRIWTTRADTTRGG